MALSIEQFQNQLTASGLFSAADVSAFLGTFPDGQQLKDGEALARELVRQKKLTKFQAEQLYAGKGNSLTLGNYVILDKLGQGGMGMVLKAKHSRMGRLVALKVMSPAAVKSKDAVKRFHREVQTAARLTHPNIVTAFDADEAKGTHFLVMEYVEGDDLSQLVKKHGAMSVEQTIECVLQAARGLEHAHQNGVIHRDIKPANLLLDKHGTVKILDMGLARLESGLSDAAGVSSAGLTQSGTIMGTVDYMSPEQAEDTRHADARADIYSLGCSLYFLLTGHVVYGGETMMKKLLAHRDAPLPSLLSPVAPRQESRTSADVGLPSDGRTSVARSESVSRSDAATLELLDSVFHKMIAKRTADRYQSMRDVIAELERCRAGESVTMNVNAVSGESGSNFELQKFLRQISGDEGDLVTNATSSSPFGTGDSVDATAETILTTGNDRGTDPQTEMTLAGERSWRSIIKTLQSRNGLLASVGVVLLLLGAWWVFRTPMGTVRIEITDDEIEVTLGETGRTLRGKVDESIKLPIGEHVLHVQIGETTFDTKELSIAKGEADAIKIERVGRRVRAMQGSTLLGHKELPKAKSSTGKISDSASAGSETLAAANYALEFDGKASYVEVPTLGSRDFGPLTVEAWVNADQALQATSPIIALNGPYWVQLNRSPGNWYAIDRDQNSRHKETTPAGRWNHLAFVLGATTSQFFVDGHEVARGLRADATITNASAPFGCIGGAKNSKIPDHFFPFHGLIDEVRISKVARYDKDFTPDVRFTSDKETLALYHFDEGQGSELKDSSGNKHYGKIVAAKWVKVEPPPPPENYALQFDGKASYVEVPTLDRDKPEPLTIEAWLRGAKSMTPFVRIEGRAPAQLHGATMWFLGQETDSAKGGFRQVEARTKLSPNSLVHAAYVIDDRAAKLFLNGVLVDTVPGPFPSPFSQAAFRGTWLGTQPLKQNAIAPPFAGVLDEVRISKVARYDKGFTPDVRFTADKDTLALYHFDEGTGSELKDSSGNNHHGKIVGAKWVSSASRANTEIKTSPSDAINLLPLIDPTKDSVHGGWSFNQAGELIVVQATPARIRIPFRPAAEYDLHIEFTRHSGIESNAQVLVAGGRQFVFALGSQKNTMAYFLLFDGKFGGSVQKEAWLVNGQRHRSLVQIRKGGVKTFLDGVPASELMTDYSSAAMPKDWEMGDPAILGIGSVSSPTTFHRIEIVEITGHGTFTRPADPSANAAEAQRSAALDKFIDAQWLKVVRALPPEEQIAKVMEKLKELNPMIPEKVFSKKITGNQVTELGIMGLGAQNLAPLRALANLKSLNLLVPGGHELSANLEGLRGMSLTQLEIHNIRVKDLSPLEGMPLESLDISANPALTDTSVLKTLPKLKKLTLQYVSTRDEAVLRSLTGLESINGKPPSEFWKTVPASANTFTNTLGMEFVRVPKGKSWLGGGGGKPGTQEVTINDDFYLGKFEVTQEEWLKVMETNPSYFSRTRDGNEAVKSVSDADLSRFPADSITWNECQEFVAKLNAKTKENGWEYRLPTDAEWQYAARGGPLGDKADSAFDFYFDQPTNQLLATQANFEGSNLKRTCPVGKYAPNRLGLHDLFGNVREWCLDEMRHPGDGTWRRVIKGGGWNILADVCRAGRLDSGVPTIRLNHLGLRVARVPVASADSTTFTNSLGMEFVRVPKGKSWLGGGGGKPVTQEVTIPNDFYLGKYEVTQDEWQKVMGTNPSSYSRDGSSKGKVKDISDENLKRFPVDQVSWDDCQTFITKLNERDKQAGWEYRLPTTSEWEYGCRGGPLVTKEESSFDYYLDQATNTLPANKANFVESELNRTEKVGSYPPNRLGLHDMHGNVYECCHEDVVDAKGTSQRRSAGGSWLKDAPGCRANARGLNLPDFRHYQFGLRVVRVPIASQAKFTNSLGMEFVRVPKGKSWLGGGGGKPGTQEVTIPDDFYLGKYEVTQEEWQKVMGTNPSYYTKQANSEALKGISDADLQRFPVENVSWEKCQQFVTRLNEKTKEAAWVYRLPKELEWEYACRGGPMSDISESQFSFYFDQPTNQLLLDQANSQPWAENQPAYLSRPCKVGSYPPNRLGLYDLHGNISEWCEDTIVDDPNAPQHAHRGGHWFSKPIQCFATSREIAAPQKIGAQIGFRVARVPVAAKSSAFQPLFNGKDLAGWQGNLDAWKVEDGKLKTFGNGSSQWLYSRQAFGEFRLQMQVWTTGNSGIRLENPAANISVELDAGAQQMTGRFDTSDKRTRPAVGNFFREREWNDFELVRRGSRVTLMLNGEKINEADASNLPELARLTGSVRIGLESNGGSVSFRDIRIAESSPPADILTSPDYEWSAAENLGPGVNTNSYDHGLTVSADGLSLVLASRRSGVQDLFECRRKSVDEPFGSAVPIKELNTPDWEGGPFLSSDGLTLLYHSRLSPNNQVSNDLFQTRRRDRNSPWETPVNLGVTVNTAASEEWPCLSSDGLTLLFASDRLGGKGQFDVWRSRRKSVDATFEAPENLGSGVNTGLSETTPKFASDNQTILFVRGGSQVPLAPFVAVLDTDGKLTARPLNLTVTGHVNSPSLSPDGRTLYFTSDCPGGQGSYDAWQIRRVRKK